MGAGNDLELVWISSHSGFPGYKVADELARTGSEDATVASYHIILYLRDYILNKGNKT